MVQRADATEPADELHESTAVSPFDLPKRSSLAESAAQAVERRIVEDGMAPGTRIGTRRELGDLLAVAPSTVSETIRLLEDRGRVVTRTGPNGGVFVAEPGVGLRLARSIMQVSGSEVEVADALEVRDILESAVICSAAEAAHTAARAGRPAARDAWNCGRRPRRRTSIAAIWSSTPRSPLCAVTRCCGRSTGACLISSRRVTRSWPCFRDRTRANCMSGGTRVHQDIADAIAKGDVAAALVAARAHAKHGRAVRAPGRG